MSTKHDKFFKQGIELNESQINSLVHMLTKRCNDRTKRRIRSMVTYDIDILIKTISWFDRFYISYIDNDIHYNAGQDYPTELSTIRKEIMRKYP